jgi:ketosteroid isomerase-like protein
VVDEYAGVLERAIKALTIKTMTESEKKKIAENFIAGLRNRDANQLASILSSDVTWTLPGESFMSGEAQGVDGILKRAKAFQQYNVHLEIEYVLYGYHDVALSLHNTGEMNGKILNEHLTTILHLQEGKAHRIETYISDVAMLNGYFV